MLLRVKSKACMTAKVGIKESGIASEEITAERQSFRKSQTTKTARAPPINSESIAA